MILPEVVVESFSFFSQHFLFLLHNLQRLNYVPDSSKINKVHFRGFPDGTVVKNLPADAGDARDMGSIPGLESSPGVGNGNPLQYSCLENSMDRGAWQAIVHVVPKSLTQLSIAHTHTHTHAYPQNNLIGFWFGLL